MTAANATIDTRPAIERVISGPPARANWFSRKLRAPLYSVAKYAARSYIAGAQCGDAIRVAGRLSAAGIASTVGYWDGIGEPAGATLERYREALRGLAAAKLDSYLSIKLPSLEYSSEMTSVLAGVARQAGLRLHFDAMAPDSVDRTYNVIDELLTVGDNFSCTLPARWKRSASDADWALKRGLSVRVVKGQWADPYSGDIEPVEGFLRIVDRLAGRAKHVAVASHNLAVLRAAFERLLVTKTPTSLELLYGLPTRRQMALAKSLGVPVRIYVPYGEAYLPYCLGELKRNPRIAWWLLRDAVRRERGNI